MAQETKKNSHLRHQVISSTQGRTTRHNSGAKRPALAPICLPVSNLGAEKQPCRAAKYISGDRDL